MVGEPGTDNTLPRARDTRLADSWSRERVQAEIAHAYNNRSLSEGNKYEGLTSSGHKINLYLDESGSINTAFPVF